MISSIIQYPLMDLCSFYFAKDRIYLVLVTQASYVAPDISVVSKSRVNNLSIKNVFTNYLRGSY